MPLYVAGDSYGSLDCNQPAGESWSEILADRLSTKLINVARPGASNVSIAIQLDWIYDNVTEGDHVVVLLTDHLRVTMLNEKHKINHKLSLLEQHSTHHSQKVVNNIYKESNILSSTINNPDNKSISDFFEKTFDPLLQYFVDTHILVGMITKMYTKSAKFFVCQGGFGMRLGTVDDSQDFSKVLMIKKENYLPLNHNFMNGLCKSNSNYINHLDQIGHLKFGSLIDSYIKSQGLV
jgi:hypothetical protein